MQAAARPKIGRRELRNGPNTMDVSVTRLKTSVVELESAGAGVWCEAGW